jgi:plastocyanin
MQRPFLRPDRRAALWMTLVCGLLLLFLLTACGGDAGGGAGGSGSQMAITITETTGGNDIYAFSPTTISIKAGDSLKFTNNSDENHKLVITPTGPNAGTVTKSGSNDNTMVVTFPTAGTFTITSQLVDRPQDGQHTPDPADSKATLTVTVS